MPANHKEKPVETNSGVKITGHFNETDKSFHMQVGGIEIILPKQSLMPYHGSEERFIERILIPTLSRTFNYTRFAQEMGSRPQSPAQTIEQKNLTIMRQTFN